MPAASTPVPHYKQSSPGACLPTCVRMILAAFGDRRTEAELAVILESYEFGTPANRVTRLEKLGYHVIVAESGEHAVDAVRRKVDELDLVILDLIMPGMDGGKTFDRIREIQPAMPVILSSGYAITGQATEIMRRGCNGFIQKPFNISELSQIIRNVLDAANGSNKN